MGSRCRVCGGMHHGVIDCSVVAALAAVVIVFLVLGSIAWILVK